MSQKIACLKCWETLVVELLACMAVWHWVYFFCTSMIEGRKRLFFEGGGREMRKKRKGDLNIILVPLSVTAANLDQVVCNKVFNDSFGWLQPIYIINLKSVRIILVQQRSMINKLLPPCDGELEVASRLGQTLSLLCF